MHTQTAVASIEHLMLQPCSNKEQRRSDAVRKCTCKSLLVGLWTVEVPLGHIWAIDADLADLASGQLVVLLVQNGHLKGHRWRSLLAACRQQASAWRLALMRV